MYNDGYIGCFLDKPDRILEVKFPDSEENNSYRCKELCRVFRYKYSGTEVNWLICTKVKLKLIVFSLISNKKVTTVL
jgi:hypothetical protein